MWKVICVFLLLVNVCAGGCTTGCISFPSFIKLPAQINEEEFSAAAFGRRFPQGIGAVQSVSDVVLNVLDLEEVRTSPKNWVVSPLSLAAVLAQLLLGSRGRLQSVLIDSLSLEKGVKPISRLEVHHQLGKLIKSLQKSSNESYTLDLNAAVFLQPEVHLKTTYKHALLDFYNAHIYTVDFLRKSAASTQKINDWINEATHGKLPHVYTSPLPLSTVAVMANVVYFNGRWQNPFDPEYTKVGPFFVSQHKKVDVEFMFGEKEVLYKNTTDHQLIGIPYHDWEVVLYILFPHERLNTSLRVDHLDELISSSTRENVSLSMPKLKLISTISVRQSVLKYLMKSESLATRTVILSGRRTEKSNPSNGKVAPKPETAADETKAVEPEEEGFDVGGASEDSRFKFDEVIHQVSLEIDEKGSEIAAVSSSLIDYIGNNFLVKINRPFWFFVRHESSLTHLFWGRIVDPSV